MTEGEDSGRSERSAWLLVMFITLLSIVSLLDRNIVALFLDDIKVHLGLSDVQASLIYGGAFAITFSVIGLPLGWAVDRLSRRHIVFAGVGLWSLATACCGLAAGFPAMLLARAGVGAGEAALVPSSQSIIADCFPAERRTLPLAFYGIGQKVGAGVALLIGGALAAIYIPSRAYPVTPNITLQGWQIILILIGLPGVAIAFLIYAFREPPRRDIDDRRGQYAGYRHYLSHMRNRWRFFTGHHLGFVITQSLTAAVMSWSPAFFMRVHGWTVPQIGLWFGTALLVGPLCALPVHGWICDRAYGRGIRDIHLRYQLLILPLALPLLCAAYIVSSGMLGLLLLGLGITIISGSGPATAAALQLTVSGDMRGKAASIWLLVGGSAAFIGPSGVAVINEKIFMHSSAIGHSLSAYIAAATILALLLFELARRDLVVMTEEKCATAT